MSAAPQEEVAKTLTRVLEGEDEALVSAYLFGSVAEDRAHRDSDVDVAVLLSREHLPTARERFERRVRLTGRLGAALRRSVDVVVLNDSPPGLGRQAVTRGVRILCRDGEADHAFVRDVQLRAADLDPFLRRMRHIKLEALAKR